MNMISPLSPTLPSKSQARISWGQLYGSSLSLALCRAYQQHDGCMVVIAADPNTAQTLQYECRFFLPEALHKNILSFPDWETLPYDNFSPHEDIISERLATLAKLPTHQRSLLIIPVSTLMQRLAPKDFVAGYSLMLKCQDQINIDEMRTHLQSAGYHCVNEVMEHGEFAVRGAIIDIFPMGSISPFRIDLFDNEIDSIRLFDPQTQRSADKVDAINVLPAREFPVTEKAISTFRQQWRSHFNGNPMDCNIYEDISAGLFPAGIEYYLPLFFEETSNLLDYLPENSLLLSVGDIFPKAEKFWQEIQERHKQLAHDIRKPILKPHEIFLPVNDCFAKIKKYSQIATGHEPLTEKAAHFNFATQANLSLLLNSRAEKPLAALTKFLDAHVGRILFCAETNGRREVLLELLKSIHIVPTSFSSWQDFIQDDCTIGITVAPLDYGLSLIEPALTLIAEGQLFGQHVMQRRRRKTKIINPDTVIKDLAELHINSPVVHIDHGVGRYVGLQTLQLGDITNEFLTIEYAGNDKLYVPVSSLHLISRYSGGDPEHAPLYRLGGEQWDKAKKKAIKRVRDVAAELLEIYARREARVGIAFDAPDEHYTVFANEFPFEETPDQKLAIEQVIGDMVNQRPMDRLVCGDVGFGKTEVAIRAAFLAVNSNKQVAILVPTTLLAQQHLNTFQDRFAGWPIRIEMISRFKTAKEVKVIIDDLKNQKVDILIGTHKLLSDNIKFHKLGLIIIDEEHRFGVRQKEKMKSLRSEVDILTLTATPIPRTLNLSMSGLRELSIIATPPTKRLSIKTFVNKREDSLLREAILREILRGGQVYFLHNSVATIANTTEQLQALVPEARVNFAHGQMPERGMEKIMTDFYHQRFNVLVCTTIIETGIDIPTANTIIIDRADKFGLAQLHQLRGRVGRSHHQAYAYLITPPEKMMTSDAKKRLEAISSLGDLGAGFTLATHDMEIRGAGELLGEEQSGQINDIGFNLYMDLLERAIKALKSGEVLSLDDNAPKGTEVDLQITSIIPEDYLSDIHARLVLYKRISNAKDGQDLKELQVEMIDRFGLLPEPVKNLFAVTELKLFAEKVGIRKLEAGAKGGRIDFTEKPNIDPMEIIKLIQLQPKIYHFDGKQRLRFTTTLENTAKKIEFLNKLMQKLLKI